MDWNLEFHFKLLNGPEIVARLSRGNVNMPDYDGSPIQVQVPKVEFEVSVYDPLRSEPDILASRLLCHRVAVQDIGSRLDIPQDIAGRHFFSFERAEGERNGWHYVGPEDKVPPQPCVYSRLL